MTGPAKSAPIRPRGSCSLRFHPMSVDLLVVHDEVAHLRGRTERLKDRHRGDKLPEREEPLRHIPVVVTQDGRQGQEVQLVRYVVAGRSVPEPELPFDPPEEDRDLDPDLGDGGAEAVEEGGSVGEDAGVDGAGPETAITGSASGNGPLKDSGFGGASVDDDSVLDGSESGVAVVRLVERAASYFFHSPSNAFLALDRHMSVDSVVSRSGITNSKNGALGSPVL